MRLHRSGLFNSHRKLTEKGLLYLYEEGKR